MPRGAKAYHPVIHRKSSVEIRNDSMGSAGHHGHADHHHENNLDSFTYVTDDSDIFRANVATQHFAHRGMFWNEGKHKTLIRYLLIASVGMVQACVAYFTNLTSNFLIESKYEHVYEMLEHGRVAAAFSRFIVVQGMFAAIASLCVWIEPISAGSGIPEVKCYMNGIDLPRVTEVKTLFCKVIGVICSVSAGLPVGKEGPMVHSGSVVAATVSSGRTRNDKQKRDFVACGATAGVCTAFSAPIGGILFALEEGASYWTPSLTWRTFFCSMVALTTLYFLNTIGSTFGKVGFNKLFSFGNFIFEGDESSYYVFELGLFVAIGTAGGLIGGIFNDTNEKITKMRIKKVNHSKQKRFVEVLCVSFIVSFVSFVLPLCWIWCTPLPDTEGMNDQEAALVGELVPFLCEPGVEYNEIASLIFTDPGVAIRQLFHLHSHAFSAAALILFFIFYISLAVLVYGIAVPSGLFVPSLLSGAAFGRLFGNLAHKLHPQLAFSNTYALIGAAAVLGGMARMTISLTVILLECTGNEQFVLPLMVTLMTARVVGGLFNDDLYHIHIHLKKGVQFLEAELRSVTRHHNLTASDIMGDHVIFVKPVEKVGIILDILKGSTHSNYAIVDQKDNDILFGTVSRSTLCVLLRQQAFGDPIGENERTIGNYLQVEGETNKFLPIVQWETIEKSYPKYPSWKDLRISTAERECLVDLRPYANTAPVSIHEFSSVERTYQLFRSIGLRFLPVVNRYNQVVGTITRHDLTPDALAEAMLSKGKKHC